MHATIERTTDINLRIFDIRQRIMAQCAELRRRHPLLNHQDALGASILLIAMSAMISTSALYVGGQIPWWACVLANAFFTSFTHELEHDLLHRLYFRSRPVAQHLMMALSWLTRPTAINPWVRRELHINHHKASGTDTDLEELTLSNGTPWGMLRGLMICDLMIGAAVMVTRAKTWRERKQLLDTGLKAYLPLTALTWAAWYVFLGFHLIQGIGDLSALPFHFSTSLLNAMHWLDAVVVIIIAPNILRNFCLNFITSNIHYYGDINPKDLTQQVQVLNPWWLWPLQAFCCNFGGTHVIHHFVVMEPFYIRQLSVPAAYRAMRENGVRFNDFGTFGRANRWEPKA